MFHGVAKDASRQVAIGALENDSHLRLTPLGFHLAHMPVDVRIGTLSTWHWCGDPDGDLVLMLELITISARRLRCSATHDYIHLASNSQNSKVGSVVPVH